MTVTEQILNGLEQGRRAFEQRLSCIDDVHIRNEMQEQGESCELALLDNSEYMTGLIASGYGGAFRLIYVDPPFFTKSKFNATVTLKDGDGKKQKIRHLAFDDRFERNLQYYIANMTERILLMKELLSDDGLLWIHLDWHSSHYIRLVLDELMGEKNFVNEIIWCYKSGGSGKRHFSRKHDSILVYSKSRSYYITIPEEKSYNRGFRPYNFRGVQEYCDDTGWYTLVNMKDVWNVDMVGRTSGERNGYATQKPLELMRRIIKAGSEEGDLVGDFFCGSGSFLEAAQMEGRRWIGCDTESLAFSVSRKRLRKSGAVFSCMYPDGYSREKGRVELEVAGKEPLDDGRILVKCTLTGFRPRIDTGYILLSDRQKLEEALKGSGLSLLEYLMIGDGDASDMKEMFRAPLIIDSCFEDMSVIVKGITPVIAVDVFGREYYAEIDPS